MTETTLLFDLDGTLLGLDVRRFLPRYLNAMTGHLRPLLPPDVARRRIEAGIAAMLAPHPGVTNAQAFRSAFVPQGDPLGLEARAMGFYTAGFEELRVETEPVPLARAVVTAARERGYTLAVVTDPLYPRVAMEARIRWSGLDPAEFAEITAFERYDAVKPDPRFYAEVLRVLGAEATSAWMIGNDAVRDLAAARVGIRTFLVEGPYTVGEGAGDRSGTVAALLEWIRSGGPGSPAGSG